MAKPRKPLWDNRKGETVGLGRIVSYPVVIPGTTLSAPCLHVDTIPDDAASLDECEAYASHVWALTAEGRDIAERIARDLARFGFAWSFPYEDDHIRIDVAPMHRLHCIARAEVDHDD